jgi:hypothetical protein
VRESKFKRPGMMRESIIGPWHFGQTSLSIAISGTTAYIFKAAMPRHGRDRDRIYGTIVTRRLRAMGIRDKGHADGNYLIENSAASMPSR